MRLAQALIASLALFCLAGQPAVAQKPETEKKAPTAAASKNASADAKAAKSAEPKAAKGSEQTASEGTTTAGNNAETSAQSMDAGGSAESTAYQDPPPPPPSATDKWLPAGLAILLAALFAGLVGWLLNRKIKALEVGFDNLRERIRSQTNQLADLREAGRQNGSGGPAAGDGGGRDYDQSRSVSPPPPPPPPREPEPAKPEPRVSRLPERLDQIRQEISALILSPGLRSTEYDAALARFGSVYGIQIAADGSSAQLVPADSDPGRRLSAIHLADEGVAVILPSSRYVKEFAMTFKESLEAGSDVKLVFDCRVDGSATLKLQRPAHARVDSSMYLGQLSRGELAGYVG